MTFFTPIRHSLLSAVLALLPAVVVAAPLTYSVRTGETLDQVIRQTMGNSPLKVELLRQAFIDQNPKAFTKTSPRYLMAGAVLNVPNHEDLLRQHLNGNKPSNGLIDERRNWVRYP
jgi:Tfp pilus assembly protein FimV